MISFRQIQLLFLLFLLSLPMAAQQNKFRVVDFQEDPLDLTAVEHEKRDANGDRYAVIKVSSENPDDELREYLFNFGYLNHITEYHNNKIWLYVQRNAKRMTIQREGYRTIDNFDLKTTIMPGKTYVMILSAEAQKVKKQMVCFNIEPKGIQANISIRRNAGRGHEELFGTVNPATGSVAKMLEYGTYSYVVRTADYEDSDGMMTLDNMNQQYVENVVLRGKFCTITLRVNTDADIFIDNEKLGTGQWTGKIRAGSHLIECRKANHKSSAQSFLFNEGENKTIDLNPPTPITGILSLNSNPAGARITIDGKDYGKTPRIIPDMIIGTHAFELYKTGYRKVMQQVEVKENQTTEFNYELTKGSDKNKTFTVASNGRKISFKMIRVEPGTFQMGGTIEDNEQPVHIVTLTDVFFIGETEVTQELWETVMGNNPSFFKGKNLPVESVSWNDCKAFISKLNELTGQQFRLPTEAEWEFAARGGKMSKRYTYSGSNHLGKVGWFSENSNNKTHVVASKSSNELNIYDMTGNVWEYCEDWYDKDYYQKSPEYNPMGSETGVNHVYRGGSWNYDASGCRSVVRRCSKPLGHHLGLRLAM